MDEIYTNIDTNQYVDIDLPTPQEVAALLSLNFSEDQANDIAEHLYQPLRELIRQLAAKT